MKTVGDPISAAIDKASLWLNPVSVEQIPVQKSIGRILAEAIVADRDSPSMNVSAMDGYAVRLSDVGENSLSVAAVACAGRPPVTLPRGQAVQIFTGAPVPEGADCIVRREDTEELPDKVVIKEVASLQSGQNIRYQGENIRAGREVLPMGVEIGPANAACLATFCDAVIRVRKMVHISLLTTGDELVEPGDPVQPWQIRDSNSLTLLAWLSQIPWVQVKNHHRVGDTLQATQLALDRAIESSDVVILTGGVSAGDTDFIPRALTSLGAEIIFHRLPIRPGRPVLVANCRGRLVIGLPGNPVSVAVTSRIIAQPLLEKLAGRNAGAGSRTLLLDPDQKSLDLYWYRLVRFGEEGAKLVDGRGSGDLISLSQSDGFIEVPPGEVGSGPWRTWIW